MWVGGEPTDPHRVVVQYHTLEGNFWLRVIHGKERSMGKTFAEAMLEKGLVSEQQVRAAEKHKHAAQMKNYENYVPPPLKRFEREEK